jgi:hypothetical protein
VRSIRTVAPTHAEALPAPSTARSCTRVSPCAETVATAPALRGRPGRAAVGRAAMLVGD